MKFILMLMLIFTFLVFKETKGEVTLITNANNMVDACVSLLADKTFCYAFWSQLLN